MNFTNRFHALKDCVLTCSYTSSSGPISENEALSSFKAKIAGASQRGGIVYVIGNGGSAGIASHFMNDLMKACSIPSQTLYDSNLMTCLSNDIGYENVFSYPLQKLLKPQDLLVAISSSGKSPNIVKAAGVALDRQTPLVTLSGFSADNPLRRMGELNFWIDRFDYGLVEAAHFFLLHTVIDLWNKQSSEVPEYVSHSVESH